MPNDLDFARYQLSQDRYGEHMDEFDAMMDYRQREAAARQQRYSGGLEARDRTADLSELSAAARLGPKYLHGGELQSANTMIASRLRALAGGGSEYAGLSPADTRQQMWNNAVANNTVTPEFQQRYAGMFDNAGDQRQMAHNFRAADQNRAMDSEAADFRPMMQERQQRVGLNIQQMQEEATREARLKAAQARLGHFKPTFGGEPGVLLGELRKDAAGNPIAGYDEKTQTAYGPEYIKDTTSGTEKPHGRGYAVPIGIANQYRNDLASTSGFDDYRAMRMADPVFAAEEGKRQQAEQQAQHDQQMMAERHQIATGMGASPQAVRQAMEMAVKVGGATEEELRNLIWHFSQQEIEGRGAARREALGGQLHDQQMQQEQDTRAARPWWQKLPSIRPPETPVPSLQLR